MTTEQVLNGRGSFVRRLLVSWRENPKKAIRVGSAYASTVAIIAVFDSLYMPWLGYKFQYFAFIPLFFSLVVVCFAGFYLYNFFKEDVFLLEKIKPWLYEEKESSYKWVKLIKEKISKSPRATFIAISIENPLIAYLFFKRENDSIWRVFGKILEGSIYCSIVWGVIIDVIVFFVKLAGESIFIVIFWILIASIIFVIIRKMKKISGHWLGRIL